MVLSFREDTWNYFIVFALLIMARKKKKWVRALLCPTGTAHCAFKALLPGQEAIVGAHLFLLFCRIGTGCLAFAVTRNTPQFWRAQRRRRRAHPHQKNIWQLYVLCQLCLFGKLVQANHSLWCLVVRCDVECCGIVSCWQWWNIDHANQHGWLSKSTWGMQST